MRLPIADGGLRIQRPGLLPRSAIRDPRLPEDMFATTKKSRIGQWDGRRRSSRSDEPVLPHLWQRPVLLRLAAVLLTALFMTVVAYHWGPSQSFRVGQSSMHDLRSRVYFEVVNYVETERKRDEAVANLPPDKRDDPTASEAVRWAVPCVVDRYPPGTLLVKRGETITDPQKALLRRETAAFLRSMSRSERIRRAAALIYSYPVTIKNGEYQIVQGLSVDEFSRKRMDATDAELREERDGVKTLLG